jgi:hypothetical protein
VLSPQSKFKLKAASRIDPEQHTAYGSNYRRLVVSRRLAELIVSSALIYVGQQFVLDNGFFAALWPATGVGLSALFLRGHFLLIGIFLGSFLSYLHNHLLLSFCLTQSTVFTFSLYALRALCLKWIGPIAPLRDTKTFSLFSLLILLFTIIPTLCLFLQQQWLFPLRHISWSLVIAAMLGQLNGVLCLTPLCLMFDPFTTKRYFQRLLQPWVLGAIFVLLIHFAFYLPLPEMGLLTLPPVLFLLITLYAAYFGQIPTCVTLLGVSVIYLGYDFTMPQLKALWITTWFSLSAFIGIWIATKRQPQVRTC